MHWFNLFWQCSTDVTTKKTTTTGARKAIMTMDEDKLWQSFLWRPHPIYFTYLMCSVTPLTHYLHYVWWRVWTSISEEPWASSSTAREPNGRTSGGCRSFARNRQTHKAKITQLYAHINTHHHHQSLFKITLVFFVLFYTSLLPFEFFFSCPSAALQLADPEAAFKSAVRGMLGRLCCTASTQQIHARHLIPSPTVYAYCVCICVFAPPSLSSSTLLSHLPKCWLESFPTCWQSAQRLIYCVTVHT